MSISADPELDEGCEIGNRITPGKQSPYPSSCALIAFAVQVALGDCRYMRLGENQIMI